MIGGVGVGGWCGGCSGVWWVWGGGGGLGGLVGLSLGVVSGALSQAVSGCFHPFSGLDYALLSNFLFLIKRGPKNTKTGKQHKTKHPQNPTHHMTAILMGEQQFFNIAECKRAEKPKIA